MDICGSAGFAVGDVAVARSRRARLRGLMWTEPHPLLLQGSSVHGFWLRGPLWVVGVGPDGTVTAVEWLRRRRVIRLRGARWALELPPGHPLPVVGERLALHARRDEASAHARPTLPLCHAHRESG
ncbi:MAG: hypothetical protein ACLFWM_00875 [Actinomycetota bacterium]